MVKMKILVFLGTCFLAINCIASQPHSLLPEGFAQSIALVQAKIDVAMELCKKALTEKKLV